MQSRRQENYGTKYSMAERLRDPRIQRGPDPYLMSRDEVVERSPRSLSPAGRVVDGGFLERRDYGWEVGGGTGRYESVHYRSGSPPFGERTPSYEKGFRNRGEVGGRYGFCDFVDRRDALDTGSKHSGFRSNFDGERSSQAAYRSTPEIEWSLRHAEDARGMILDEERRAREAYKSLGELERNLRDAENARGMILDEVSRAQGAYRSTAEVERNLRDAKGARGMILDEERRAQGVCRSPVGLDQNLRHDEDVRGMILDEGRRAQGAYRSPAELEQNLRHAEGARNLSSSSRSFNIGRIKDDRIEYPDPYLLERLSAMEKYGNAEKHAVQLRNFPRFTGSASQSRDFADISQLKEFAGASVGSSRENTFVPCRDRMLLPTDIYPRSSAQQVEQIYSEFHQRQMRETGRGPESRSKDMQDYERGAVNPSMADRWNHLYHRPELRENDDYDHPSAEMCRRMLMDEEEDYYQRDIVLLTEHDYVVNAEYSGRLPRSSSEQGRTNADFERLDMLHEDALSCQEKTYAAERGAMLVSHRERRRTSPDTPHKMGMHGDDLGKKGQRSYELEKYDPLEWSLERRYGRDENLSQSGKSDNLHRAKDEIERSEEWKDILPSRSSEYYHDRYTRVKGTIDSVEHDIAEYMQEQSIKPLKPIKRNLKGYHRRGFANWYNSHNFSKRQCLTKNVWMRDKEDKQLDECLNEAEGIEDWASSFNSGSLPPEDSKEFKQLVHSFFLSFSKKLNKSYGTQKRYQDQGRAGPLFCIVCGKSLSKEFKDTQGLVTHCYMSKKLGLRAQHLGLHKAICVLLGWKSVVSPDVTTFFPQTISDSEALTQKEDLILWPPLVVIHNISVLACCPGAQKLFAKEAVEDFLRVTTGKGFTGGKIKVCLGRSANNSIMIVKFLSTVNGLQDAEKLHMYFMNAKRGRTDFEGISLVKGQDSSRGKGRMQGDKLVESELYGYMGIAEDLDKVDFDTKKRCSIKSKKEIQDFVNAPIYKPYKVC